MNPGKEKFYLALLGLAATHKKYSMQQFNQLNLTTGQPKVLAILLEREGYLQKELAKRCHIEPATLTTILKNMESKDLIQKRPVVVSGGKKAYSIYMTEHGRKVAEEMIHIVEEAEEICFQGFAEDEKECMITWMTKIQANIEKELSFEEVRKDEA